MRPDDIVMLVALGLAASWVAITFWFIRMNRKRDLTSRYFRACLAVVPIFLLVGLPSIPFVDRNPVPAWGYVFIGLMWVFCALWLWVSFYAVFGADNPQRNSLETLYLLTTTGGFAALTSPAAFARNVDGVLSASTHEADNDYERRYRQFPAVPSICHDLLYAGRPFAGKSPYSAAGWLNYDTPFELIGRDDLDFDNPRSLLAKAWRKEPNDARYAEVREHYTVSTFMLPTGDMAVFLGAFEQGLWAPTIWRDIAESSVTPLESHLLAELQARPKATLSKCAVCSTQLLPRSSGSRLVKQADSRVIGAALRVALAEVALTCAICSAKICTGCLQLGSPNTCPKCGSHDLR